MGLKKHCLGIVLAAIAVGCTAETASPPPPQQPEPPPPKFLANDRPRLDPLPQNPEIWECEVVVVGGSLGGVAAAAQAMRSGSITCLIEVSPWLGGQISTQGVSAIDESLTMRANQNFSPDWLAFKQVIREQAIDVPAWLDLPEKTTVAEINACWVGALCFPPKAGAKAAQQWLAIASQEAPDSRWSAATAFKGAEFDQSGREITAIYAVSRQPRQPDYVPQGRFSQEISQWYAWSETDTFEKTPLRLQAPQNKRLIVIDATDTGELVGWADLPYRLGSEAKTTTGEVNAASRDNPDCTQALTYPFAIALQKPSNFETLIDLPQLKAYLPSETGYTRAEHRRDYQIEGFPMFSGKSFFHYRRILSTTQNDPFTGTPALGDISMINWNRGNDWNLMNPPLILNREQLAASGQLQNWHGGLSTIALKHAEDHALFFAEWLLETQSRPEFPLVYLAGEAAPMGTESGLSIMPYLREGRRILGRSAYGQNQFMVGELDVRKDLSEGRDFTATKVAVTQYDLDFHGCRYRNWEPSGEATSAPAREFVVRPIEIPLESLIPQEVDNLLMGGKAIAVTHIVNAATRVHHGEWSVGATSGAIAGFLTTKSQARSLNPNDLLQPDVMPTVQTHLIEQGLRFNW